MNYEKKYKEALERARVYHTGGSISDAHITEVIFPELKESDDERMLREIKRYIQEQGDKPTGLPNGTVPVSDMITWLEKQGENKPTDKIEPKFKVGDFIINDYCLGKVIEITNDAYLLDTGQGIPFSCEHNAHLWTIKDAKDGDVLTTDNFIFIFKSIDNNNGVHYYCHYEISKHEDDSPQFGVALPQSLMGIVGSSFTHYKPATKNERDLLFQKMKEAGYEWDANKKELKKMEVVSKESEDEKIKKEIIRIFKGETRYTSKEDADKYIAWLEKQGENKPTSKVEPKFKVGDGITDGYIYYKITEILDDRYIIESKYDKRGAILFEYENRYHLWTIQDAKDGDVLCYETKDDFIIFIYKNGHIHYHCCYSNGHLTTIDSFFVVPKYLLCYIHPATKEQCDVLFSKMKEAGYEWDANKRELKKIEAASKESEDEKTRKELIAFLEENLSLGYPDETWDSKGLKRWIAWLEKQTNKD